MAIRACLLDFVAGGSVAQKSFSSNVTWDYSWLTVDWRRLQLSLCLLFRSYRLESHALGELLIKIYCASLKLPAQRVKLYCFCLAILGNF